MRRRNSSVAFQTPPKSGPRSISFSAFFLHSSPRAEKCKRVLQLSPPDVLCEELIETIHRLQSIIQGDTEELPEGLTEIQTFKVGRAIDALHGVVMRKYKGGHIQPAHSILGEYPITIPSFFFSFFLSFLSRSCALAGKHLHVRQHNFSRHLQR